MSEQQTGRFLDKYRRTNDQDIKVQKTTQSSRRRGGRSHTSFLPTFHHRKLCQTRSALRCRTRRNRDACFRIHRKRGTKA